MNVCLTLRPFGFEQYRAVLLGAVLLGGLTAGCAPDATHRDRREDTLTSGVLTIAAEPDVAPVLVASAQAFERLYPEASIRVLVRSSRDAMADVFANRADLAVIGRETEMVERQAATEARIDMEAYRWARDGVAVITHPTNPVNQLSFDDLREILTVGETSWGEFGGPDRRVVPVIEPPTRSLTQYVARQILEREDILTAAMLADDDSAVIAQVARVPDALGFVSQSSLRPGVKVLAVSRARGLPYVELDAETVYRKDYPLTRSYNLVTRVPGLKLGQGFVTFALSEPGQRFVRDGHRVPASVPVRFTRRLPTASSH
ncbi:MAG: substrate-binding domain-containing protein [Candidatus Eisenbacteria bacterium]